MSYSDLHACDAEDPFFFPFSDTSSVNSAHVLPEFAEYRTQVPVNEPNFGTVLSYDLVGSGSDFHCSSSPPCCQLENLCLYPSGSSRLLHAPFQQDMVCVFNGVGVVTTEESDSYNSCRDEALISRKYNGPEGHFMMQRNCIGNENRVLGNVRTFSDGWMDSPADSSDSFFSGQIRRACSTGDLQSMRARVSSSPRAISSRPAGMTSLDIGEPNSKAVRCSARERKEKILKYRAKRSQRNFNKTIKHACRKTLADNRPRVCGRFARNNEVGVPGKAAFLVNDDFWVGNGMHEDQEEEEFYGGAIKKADSRYCSQLLTI